MNSYHKDKDEELLLRINTQKFSAIPMKNAKKESSIVITTAKKSSVKAKIKCDRCQNLLNRYDIKVCNGCGKHICAGCFGVKRGNHYCLECL